MPHDARRYAVITHDFADSPKLQILPVESRWTLLEMILYSCRMHTDGRLSKRLANARWGLGPCQDLLENDPDNPSLLEDGEDYVIHDFLEHQTPKEKIFAQKKARQEAGRKGGLAKARRSQAQKDSASKPLANAKANAKQTASKSPSKPLANLKQNKNKKGGGISDLLDANAAQNQAESPPQSLDELAAAHAASQHTDTCSRHPDGNPTGEPCWECGQIKARQKRHAEEQASTARAQRRAAIDSCDLCDHNGWVLLPGTQSARKCDHEPRRPF